MSKKIGLSEPFIFGQEYKYIKENKIKNLNNPLLSSSPSEKIYSKITNFNFSAELTKNFYDLQCEKNE